MTEHTARLRALVERWRQGAGPGDGDYYFGQDVAYRSCADELEAVLSTLQGEGAGPCCDHTEDQHESFEYRGDKPRYCMVKDCGCKRFRATPARAEGSHDQKCPCFDCNAGAHTTQMESEMADSYVQSVSALQEIAAKYLGQEGSQGSEPAQPTGWHCEGCITAMWCDRHGSCLAEAAPPERGERR